MESHVLYKLFKLPDFHFLHFKNMTSYLIGLQEQQFPPQKVFVNKSNK